MDAGHLCATCHPLRCVCRVLAARLSRPCSIPSTAFYILGSHAFRSRYLSCHMTWLDMA